MEKALKIPMLLVLTVLIAPGAYTAAAQERNTSPAVANAEAIHEHLDEAEEAIEMLLDWRHVLTTATRQPLDTTPPTEPATTLVSVPRADVERLAKLLDAAAVMVPKPSTTTAAPRGDLRAHIEKAQEIARELMPAAAAGPVGTSGGSGNATMVVDRAALERLEIEIDAMERVAPRRLSSR
jgi:hypothetical protein